MQEAERTQIRLLDKRPRVWKYLTIKEGVTAVTTVTASHTLAGNFTINKEKINTKPCDTRDTCDANNPHSQQTLPQTPLIQTEPIHYHRLPSNEPHPRDKYGCAR